MKLYFFAPIIVLVFFVLAIVFIGELRFRWLKRHEGYESENLIPEPKSKTGFQKVISLLEFPNIDEAFGILKIESLPDCMVSSSVMQRRGSWRMAQGRVLFDEDFQKLIEDEYTKML